MVDLIASWRYTENVEQRRRDKLAEAGSFENIVRLVTDEARNIIARPESGRDPGLTHCIQPIFSIELPSVGDSLFNGPWGIRAQYWISPGQGLSANGSLLVALMPKLIAAIDIASEPGFAHLNVCAALLSASAKIWINEAAQTILSRDLAVERWVLEAEKGVELAELGIWAPEATSFEVRGALMDCYGNEVVPARKVQRHYDIYNYGFS